MPSNKTIVDFRKIAYCDYYFRNQYGDISSIEPHLPTLFGHEVDPKTKLYKSELTVLEKATREKALDRWIPQCKFQLSNSHSLTYTGEKAKSMHKAYRAYIFDK